MADGSPIQTIPNLPPAVALAGPEQFWINQAGVDLRATVDDFSSYVETRLGYAGSVVTSFNGRHGDIFLTAADITATGFGVGSFVPLSGNVTVTGPLTFASASGHDAFIALNKSASGPSDYILGSTAGLARWKLVLGDAAPEAGANTGSNFDIMAYTDAGSLLDTWFSIDRATGVVTASYIRGKAPGGVLDNFTMDAGTF
jgi:hypothetical protein